MCLSIHVLSVWISGYDPLSTVVLSHTSSPIGTRRIGTDVAEAVLVHISPNCSTPRSSGEGPPGQNKFTASSTVLAEPGVVLGPSIPPRRLSFGDSGQEGVF